MQNSSNPIVCEHQALRRQKKRKKIFVFSLEPSKSFCFKLSFSVHCFNPLNISSMQTLFSFSLRFSIQLGE